MCIVGVVTLSASLRGEAVAGDLRQQIHVMEETAIHQISTHRKKLTDDAQWQAKLEERIRSVESRDTSRPESQGSNRPEAGWEPQSTGGTENGQMMKALAEMLNNQSARDRVLTSSLEDLRKEQLSGNADAQDLPLLHQCLEEIKDLKVRVAFAA